MNKSLIACNILAEVNQDELKLAIVGKWKGHVNGPFEITLEDLNQMKKNFDAGNVDLVIDLDHATILNGTGEAYGWIKELEVRGDELWANKVEWLEHGKELIKSGKYKYISPVFLPNTIDQATGNNIGWTLHSAALTNRPFLEELGEVVANNKNQNEGESGMTPEEKEKMEGLESKVTTLETELNKEKEKNIETQVDAAIAANKVNPEQKDSLIALGKTNPDSLKDFLDKAKAIVVAPGNDMYLNNNQNNQDEKIDVLKLGGIN